MRIVIGDKFTSIHLDNIIRQYWDLAKKASSKEQIVFDLKDIEWIATEELTFLFGWFRYLKHLGKNIYIELPPIHTTDIRKKRRLVSLYLRWRIDSFLPINNSTGYKEIEKYFNVSEGINKIITAELEKAKKTGHLDDNSWHKIIPFYALDANFDQKRDNLRDELKTHLKDVFTLEHEIEQLLNAETAYSPFHNRTLSHIISTELFLNVIHHSFDENTDGPHQCYMAVVLSNFKDVKKYVRSKSEKGKKIEIEDAEKELHSIVDRSYITERPLEESLFYKSKVKGYRNEPFIEFTFLDFGKGIPATLREKYDEEITNEDVKRQLSAQHFNMNLDTRVLEYAFLLHSSRNPFDVNIQIQSYVPRGLFFLVDIVRRYSGMVIARGNHGKVVFDFSDNTIPIKECVRFSNDDDKLPFFQGTLISIVLPTNKKDILLNAVQKQVPKFESKATSSYEYISISDILLDVEKNNSNGQIYNQLFKKINDQLIEYNKKKSLVIIDFAGCDNNVIDQKIYYYLCNTPHINENCQVVILNPHDRHILENVRDSILSSDVFLFRPIPCVVSQSEIIWIGIKDINHEAKLNGLWRYSDTQVSLAVSDFDNAECLLGNIINIEWVDDNKLYGNVKMSIPAFDDFFKLYSSEIVPQKYLEKFIGDPNNKVLLKSNDNVYWTSSGYYQTEYISFIEKLYYVENVGQEKEDRDEYFGLRVSQYLLNKLDMKLGTLPDFTKIVAVTLSSHLLARYIRDKYCEMKGLKKDAAKPQIINLTNYYEFATEKSFQKINQGENIIVVHDVISTGELNKKIYESLKNGRKANVLAVVALLDTRNQRKDGSDGGGEVKSVFDSEIDEKLLSLAKYPIPKYLLNPTSNTSVIAINPILNAPSTMELHRSDTFKLIYSDSKRHIAEKKTTKDFLNKIDNKYLWVGHLHHHTAHHAYFMKTADLFQSTEGKNLLQELFTSLKHKENELKGIKVSNAFSKLTNDINEIRTVSNDAAINKTLDDINKKLSRLGVNQIPLPIMHVPLNIDYVFYPMYSGAELISKKELSTYLDLDENRFILFPMPRIDTSKGWRFTFPPKMLNKPIENSKSKVLIIDDGSCTGETLLQMIDSICFLKVSSILVLSIIARLDDFQREFFSRIQKMKVDYTREGETKTEISVVPIEIYFGVHLHIPSFAAFTSACPFCNEIEKLDTLLNSNPPNAAKTYIQKRKEDLQLYETDGILFTQSVKDESNLPKCYVGLPPYFPKGIDIKSIYHLRDRLGRLETYRLFTEYINSFENDNFNDDSLEIYLAVILMPS